MPERFSAKMDFSGRVALVTGGASGIGFAVASQLAELGAYRKHNPLIRAEASRSVSIICGLVLVGFSMRFGFGSRNLAMLNDFRCLFRQISAGVKQAAWLP
jgi:hypothetical protein